MKKRRCFRKPIPEIYDVAKYLDAAVSAHLSGEKSLAFELCKQANKQVVWDWTESIWGAKSPFVNVQRIPSLHTRPKEKNRMPTAAMKRELRERDGYHCRFCGIPVIRAEIRQFMQKEYPEAVPWGKTNASQHAGFQCLWLQYDHVIPHSAGGENTLDNIIVTCSACNFGKVNYSIEELNLFDPREFEPVQSTWDGLERVLSSP